MSSNTKVCKLCRETKVLTEFGLKGKSKTGVPMHQHACRICYKLLMREYNTINKAHITKKVAETQKVRRQENKLFVERLKEQMGCVVCLERVPCALDFHHTDYDKDDNIAHMLNNSTRKAILKEIAKCEILCGNCHRKYHAGIIELPPKRHIQPQVDDVLSLGTHSVYKQRKRYIPD